MGSLDARGDTYLITANHVVADAPLDANRVTVKQKNRTWAGTVIGYDDVNDLAVVRVAGEIAPPLWQRPDLSLSPLVGTSSSCSAARMAWKAPSPRASLAGLPMTRSDRRRRQPRQLRRPAVDRQGHVVGVLLAGGAETSTSPCRSNVRASPCVRAKSQLGSLVTQSVSSDLWARCSARAIATTARSPPLPWNVSVT